jgi:hypothetical protein
MSFQPKPNSGVLWPNDRKSSDNHPDMRGDLFISRDLLRSLASKDKDPLIKISVSAWSKVIAGKQCYSLSASEPYVRQETKAEPVRADYDDSDVPF